MDNRYFYVDGDGVTQGPLWLSGMRALWRNGKLRMSTEVSLNGTDAWERMEFYPEVYELAAQLPGRPPTVRFEETAVVPPARSKSNPTRLLVWTVLLFLAYVTWVLVHWDDGKRLKLGNDNSAAAEAGN